MTVNEPANFDVTLTSVDSAVTEGETVAVAYEVTNTGDVADTQDIGFAVNGTTEDTASSVTLNGSETVSGQFSYATSAGDAPAVTVAVLSVDDSATQTVTVNEPASFDVTISSIDSAVTAGETITVAYEVTNIGDVADTQDIGFAVNGTTEDTETGVTLNGSETFSGQFTYQTVAGDAPAVNVAVLSADDSDSNTVTVNEPSSFVVDIVETNTPVEGEQLNVTTSIENTGDVQDSQEVTLDVGPLGTDSTTVTLGGGSSTNVTLSVGTGAGDAGAYTVTVASEDDTASANVTVNVGDVQDAQNVTFAVNGSVEDTESGVTLNGSETFSRQFSYITSDADTPVVSVTVSSEDTTASADVIVRGASGLVVTNLTTPAATTVGDSLNITATISNTGTNSTTQQFNLTVNGTTVDTTTVSLDGGNATAVQLTWQTGAGDDGNATVRLSGGDAAATTDITVAPLTVADYADENGIVTTLGLFDAIEDWREDLIETRLFFDVIDAWRSDGPVT